MGNHVIYDKLWESDRLTQCSRDAALAYPWIFLVADDHGRFQYRPRRIWTKVFGGRPDVTLDEVTSWLLEYWSVGLLERFGPRGDLAIWYKFQGRKPSERRPSELKDPDTWEPFTEGRGTGAQEGRKEGASGAEPGRQIDARAEIEQSGDRAEQSRADTCAPSAPVAPPPTIWPDGEMPRTPATEDDAKRVALEVLGPPPERPWSDQAIDHWQHHLGSTKNMAGRIGADLKPLVLKHGWGKVEPLWVQALEEAALWDSSERFTPDMFARTFEARARKQVGRDGVNRALALTHASRAGPRLNAAQAREDAAMAGIQGGLTPCTSKILEDMRDRRKLDGGIRAHGGQPPRQGPHAAHEGAARRDPARGDEPPDGRAVEPGSPGGPPEA